TLGERAAASAQLLKERIEAEITALSELSRDVGNRADETDQLLRGESERLTGTANALSDGFRATFAAETERLDERATAAAELLKQRIGEQIRSLETLSETVGQRSDTTERTIRDESERLTAAAGNA